VIPSVAPTVPTLKDPDGAVFVMFTAAAGAYTASVFTWASVNVTCEPPAINSRLSARHGEPAVRDGPCRRECCLPRHGH